MSRASASRLSSVSVDLDPLRCYHEIHALPPAPSAQAHVVLQRALPRFLELFARHGIQATLFVVGSDLATGENRKLLAQAVQAGHELGNHTHGHPYALSRLPREAAEREIGDCHHALADLVGRPPMGFRAPGYELQAETLEILEAFGYRYDSSIFPCPPYYLAKLAVMAKMALLRQPSGAIIGAPQAQLAPLLPYRPDGRAPWRRGHASLIELPIAVTPHLRLPAIGTSLLLSAAMRAVVLAGMARQPFFNLELHGMDLVGADEDDIPDPLRSRQPDLRVPLKTRLAALDDVLHRLKARGPVLPLHAVAEQHAAD